MRKVPSDRIIRNRWVAPLQMCPSVDWTFRRGRAIIVVMSRSVGQGMFLHSQICFASFQMVLLWLASQLKRMHCMVLGELHWGHIPLSLCHGTTSLPLLCSPLATSDPFCLHSASSAVDSEVVSTIQHPNPNPPSTGTREE